MAMTAQYWSLSGLAVELKLDRRTIASKLRAVPPDCQVSAHPAWLMSTAVAAIYQRGERVDLSAARAKLASTQEELCRLRVDRERGALLPAEEVEAGWM